MLIVFGKVLSIFLMILVGFIANRLKILTDEALPHITNLLLYVTSPCMMLASIYSKELSRDVITSTVQVMVGALIYFALVTLLAFVIAKVFRFRPEKDRGVYIVAMASINNGFMGFPVTKAIFGNDIFYLMVMHNILLNLYIYGAVPPLLDIGGSTKVDCKKIIKSMCNICVFAVIAGFIMLLAGLHPPQILDELIVSLGDATIPLSMLLVGIQLGSSKLGNIFKNKYMLLTTFFAMVLIPALTFLVVDSLSFLNTDAKVALIFASAFPTAVASVAIAEQQGKNGQALAEIVSLTTFTSLLTIPLIATFLTGYYYGA